jgi:hypothetical protein
VTPAALCSCPTNGTPTDQAPPANQPSPKHANRHADGRCRRRRSCRSDTCTDQRLDAAAVLSSVGSRDALCGLATALREPRRRNPVSAPSKNGVLRLDLQSAQTGSHGAGDQLWLIVAQLSRSSNVTATPSPDDFATAFRMSRLTGRLWVPSASAINDNS